MARVKFDDGHVEDCVSLSEMIEAVEYYLLITKRVRVSITPPENDRQLQLLGKAYDVVKNGSRFAGGINFEQYFYTGAWK